MIDQPTGELVRFTKNDVLKTKWNQIFKFR